MAKAIWILACWLSPALGIAQDGDDPPAGAIRIEGRLTDEGVECQALRADDGTLYTLLGDLGELKAGDAVELEATRVDVSFCMQGRTLRVHRINRKPLAH